MDKSKIAIVVGCNIHWAPYYYRYEKFLCDERKRFDVILWNREHIKENVSGRLIEFDILDKSNDHNPKKVFKFWKFAKFVKRQLELRDYEKIIFLGLQGCALPLNAIFLSKNFRGRYWVDIRDYHYEWFKPYYLLEKMAIDNSYYAVISSSGFKSFLPSYKYGIIHNIDPNMQKIVCDYQYISSQSIRISFIGNVRYFKENVELLEKLGNDQRFCLQYFGPGGERLYDYCVKKQIKNVKFMGAFSQDRTKELYEKTDIINNIYGNTLVETKTALSNKLYYAIYLQMPIIVSPGTYMEKVTQKYGFSIAFTNDRNFADMLYDWYQKFKADKDKSRRFNMAKNEIEKQELDVKKKIREFINS